MEIMSIEEARKEYAGQWIVHNNVRHQITNISITHGFVNVITEYLCVNNGELAKEGDCLYVDSLERIGFDLEFIEVTDLGTTIFSTEIDTGNLFKALFSLVDSLGIDLYIIGNDAKCTTKKDIVKEIAYYTKFAEELWG